MWIFYFSFFLSDVLLSYRLSLLHPSLIPSTDLPDHHSLLLLVMSICFISVCVSSSSSSLHTRFSSHLFFCSLLSSYLTRDYSTVQHHAPLLIPHSFFPPLPGFPSLTLSTPFLSPPLCHPSIKTPTDGPEPSAQATFWPSFFSPALHVKRRPIKVRLPFFFHSVVLISVCLHSDSLGSLIKTLYFLFSFYSTFFSTCSSNVPLFFSFVPPLCSNLSQQLSFHQSPSVFIWASSHVTPSLTLLPSFCHTFLSSFTVSCSVLLQLWFIQSLMISSCKIYLPYFVLDVLLSIFLLCSFPPR